MPILAMSLAVLAAPHASRPYPHPNQKDYRVANAFVAIVRRDAEVNIQDLSYAFGLPELLNGSFIWSGPFGGYSEPRFSAAYDPPRSSAGITKIVITWEIGSLVTLNRKPAISQSLTIFLRPDSCPSEKEMASATGVSMMKLMMPGYHGGPPYPTQWFNMPDANGRTKSIEYSADGCKLSANFTRDL